MRALASFALTSTIALAAACAPREKVIIIKEPVSSGPTGDKNAQQVDGSNPIASDGDRPSSDDPDWGIKNPSDSQEYARVIEKVANMVSDGDLQARVRRRTMSVVNVMWEDTGRAQGSALGPNISDLTLQVRRRDESGQFQSSIMPVIRHPNFSDKTGDVPADRFFIRVGNEQRNGSLRSVPLTDVLKNLKGFASRPESILGDGNMLAPRDSHFLVSAQAVFLPIAKSGKSQFNPVLFNYQSAPGAPAVLTILVTRQGSSMQVIENKGDDVTSAGWGQELYFNNNGNRAAFTAERKSDVEQRIAAQGGPKTEDDKSALQRGADTLFLVQIPLKHANLGRLGGALPSSMPKGALAGGGGPIPKAAAKPADEAAPSASMDKKSDVEHAVLGHGPNVGPFNEGHGLRFERDPKFPIRITVQFYKATSNGIVSDVDLDGIAKSIGSVYEHAEFVGSLVLPDGDPRRPTAWQKVPREWFPW
jgi:hypothetical protein